MFIYVLFFCDMDFETLAIIVAAVYLFGSLLTPFIDRWQDKKMYESPPDGYTQEEWNKLINKD